MVNVPSIYQEAVFDNVKNGSGNTVIIARAGSGKTTTIIEAMRYIPRSVRNVLFVAFNKSIQVELARRVPKGVAARTMHSLGNAALIKEFGKLELDKNRMMKLACGLPIFADRPLRETGAMRRALVRCCSFAKATLAGYGKRTFREDIEGIIEQFDIDPGKDLGLFIDCVSLLLERAKEVRGTIDFDDQVYLPVVLSLKLFENDMVFIDETQDLNAAQIELSLRACKRVSGRIIAVGDDCQAIYAFRGADHSAIPGLIKRLNATVLPLSVSYRCAHAIVKQAKEIVSDIEAAPNASEGLVKRIDTGKMLSEAKPGDFILSRTNAPLVGICLSLLREGRKATIQGRDFSANLAGTVRASRASTCAGFRSWLAAWQESELARLHEEREGDPREGEAIVDRYAVLMALSEGAKDVAEILCRIDALFSDCNDEGRIVLSTTHKAKGLERERVFLLIDTYLIKRRDEAGQKEEENLLYVAITRAKRELYYVSPG